MAYYQTFGFLPAVGLKGFYFHKEDRLANTFSAQGMIHPEADPLTSSGANCIPGSVASRIGLFFLPIISDRQSVMIQSNFHVVYLGQVASSKQLFRIRPR